MDNATATRIKRINAIPELRAERERQAEWFKARYHEELLSRIEDLKPRIEDLLTTVNACINAGVTIDNGLFTPVLYISYVAFVENKDTKEVTEIKVVDKDVEFRTDGTMVYDIDSNGKCNEATNEHLEIFVKVFKDFERDFYAKVDKALDKEENK